MGKQLGKLTVESLMETENETLNNIIKDFVKQVCYDIREKAHVVGNSGEIVINLQDKARDATSMGGATNITSLNILRDNDIRNAESLIKASKPFFEDYLSELKEAEIRHEGQEAFLYARWK